ncbi:hypothetical protein ACFFIX_13200 [Metabacillus herbersteinensis]|uniref:Uncharacterized protein n=1 Tax=Metabacillus herbersteinensis TaxID=283816 RepID=A0ABV6GG54_9BACI
MKKLGGIVLQFIFACTGIILIGALPSIFLIEKGQWINFLIFFETIGTILHALVNFKEKTFMIRGEVY